MTKGKPLIYDHQFAEIDAFVLSVNQPSYRTKQIWLGLYHQFWTGVDQFSTLPKSFRGILEDKYLFSSLENVTTVRSSDESTWKSLFNLRDRKTIETVLMKYNERNTLCVSSQSGCAVGCVFCATGQMGFVRNLSAGEIIEQVVYFSNVLRNTEEKITNIVIMGMGEPFLNYDNTLKAIDILNDEAGYKLGSRRFTISTVGIIPGIRRFASEKRQVNLAISLHSANDETRSSLIPINQKYPLSDLADACLEYIKQTKRRISFEWAMINGVNDSPKDAVELTDWLNNFKIDNTNYSHVNLIPLNPTEGYKGIRASVEKVNKFRELIIQRGVPCTVRVRRGIDVYAGCGQLSAVNLV